jgi:hypothetical protein
MAQFGSKRFSWALTLTVVCIFSFHAAAQESRVSLGSALTANDAATASPAPSPASSSSSLSQECQQRLQQLELQSNMPVVMIQIAAAPAGATAAELQLLAKGPRLPGLMTTCGGPGEAKARFVYKSQSENLAEKAVMMLDAAAQLWTHSILASTGSHDGVWC